MLYGEEKNDPDKRDRKFENMMNSFNRLQANLGTQQLQLGNLIKQVNGLIDHREQKE